MNRLNFLKEISEAAGIPGFESDVRNVMRKYSPDTVEVDQDFLGNLICQKTGDQNGPRIMIPGHMDEIGLMVNLITNEGHIKFIPLGGWWDQVMLSQRVNIHTKDRIVPGVIGSKPPHILKKEEREKVVTKDKMFIDVGASSKDDVEKMGIEVGDPIIPESPFTVMANEKVLMGKAWDDRVGCAAIIELLRELEGENHPNTVFGVGTVQEEVGLRGAKTSVNTVNPDVCIALDVGVAGDMPGVTEDESPLKLGGGPVMYLADHYLIAHVGLRRFVSDLAKKNNIPLQFATLLGGGTDAGAIHTHLRGVPSLTLGIPVRYVHAHAGLMHLDDYQHLVNLLKLVVINLDWNAVNELRGC